MEYKKETSVSVSTEVVEDEFDEEELRQKYKDWDWWQLLPLIAERVESMTFGANAFVIDKGGWTTVKTCSHDQMIEYYS